MTAKKPVNAAKYRQCIVDMIKAEGPDLNVVEVGVYLGGLSQLLNALPNVQTLTIIDPWAVPYSGFSQSHMDDIAAKVAHWAKYSPKVRILRMKSMEAVDFFEDESIDFFHTDGDHNTPEVINDCGHWWPKLKKGCLFTGDNYEQPCVAKGVNYFFPYHQTAAKGRVWWIRK